MLVSLIETAGVKLDLDIHCMSSGKDKGDWCLGYRAGLATELHYENLCKRYGNAGSN